jgi:hypothetical protein
VTRTARRASRPRAAHGRDVPPRALSGRAPTAQRLHAAARAFASLALCASLLPACSDPDAATLDAAPFDASVSDAALPDASAPDAAPPDASAPDAAPPDASAPDAALDERAALDALLARLRAPDADAAALDAIRADIALSARWPLVRAGQLVFLTRWDEAAGPVALVSDLDAWRETARPAERLASGVHHLVVIPLADVSVPLAGAKYKWWHAPAAFRAPPEATAHGDDAFGAFGYVAPPTDVPWRERFPNFRSRHLGEPRALRARLPAGFVPHAAAAARARVALFHDGQNVFEPDAPFGGLRAGEALDAPAFRDVVALAVDNAPDRFDAYTPVTDDIGSGPIGGRADAYLALLDDEALPFFAARYGIPIRGDSLALAGASLGGLVSLHAALADDTRQACVIAMSSTIVWGSIAPDAPRGRTVLDAFRTRGHGATALYLDSGGGPGSGCVDTDADGLADDATDATDNYCETTQLRDALDALGYDFGIDLAHWHEPAAPHAESAWAARLPRALSACAAMGWVAR